MGFKVTKGFNYSTDGVRSRWAAAGDLIDDIPVQYIEGLVKEGWIAKDAGAAPENKMQVADENKATAPKAETKPAAPKEDAGWKTKPDDDDLAGWQAEYFRAFGKEPHGRMKVAGLKSAIEGKAAK